MNLYCLEIVRAYPNYKRPYASVSVYHFLTIKEANEKRREEKKEYYSDFLSMLETPEYIEEDENDIPIVRDVDNIDEQLAHDFFYCDSYMDMEPFAATLYQITIENGNITSEIIPFPSSHLIEGV